MTKAKIEKLDLRSADLIKINYKQAVDLEDSHYQNDTVLCDLLRLLGFNRTADAFEATDKWYA